MGLPEGSQAYYRPTAVTEFWGMLGRNVGPRMKAEKGSVVTLLLRVGCVLRGSTLLGMTLGKSPRKGLEGKSSPLVRVPMIKPFALTKFSQHLCAGSKVRRLLECTIEHVKEGCGSTLTGLKKGRSWRGGRRSRRCVDGGNTT
jgi:hypothetical protein